MATKIVRAPSTIPTIVSNYTAEELPYTIYIGLMSDLHLGARHVDEGLIKDDLDWFAGYGAKIIVNGDPLDLLLPTDLKRFTPSTGVKDLAHYTAQIDEHVRRAYEFLKPYAKNIVLIGDGNHTTEVVKRHSTDPTSTLINYLNAEEGADIAHGGYSGYWRARVYYKGKSRFNFYVRYHHGSGGSAPVTKGFLVQARMMQWLGNANVLTLGHLHNKWVDMTNLVETVSPQGKVSYKPMPVIMTGSYYTPSPACSGWAQQRNFSPQATGGHLLKVTFSTTTGGESKTAIEVVSRC